MRDNLDPELPDIEPPELPEEEEEKQSLAQPEQQQAGSEKHGMAGELLPFRTEPLPPPIGPEGYETNIAVPSSKPLPHDSLPPRVDMAAPLGEHAAIAPRTEDVAQQMQTLIAAVQQQGGKLEEILTALREIKDQPKHGTYY
jgi:hypothetical protein